MPQFARHLLQKTSFRFTSDSFFDFFLLHRRMPVRDGGIALESAIRFHALTPFPLSLAREGVSEKGLGCFLSSPPSHHPLCGLAP